MLLFISFSALHFHRFPSDPIRKNKWISNIRREHWMPSKQSRICSDYFTENCFDRTGKIVRLLPDAVPTRFKAFAKHLKQASNLRLLIHFYSFIILFHVFYCSRDLHIVSSPEKHNIYSFKAQRLLDNLYATIILML